VHEVNESVGEEYGYSIEGYGPAERYRKYYEESIREELSNMQSLDVNVSDEELRAKGREKAAQKLIDDLTKPLPDGTPVFPTFGPAAYFFERKAAETQESMKQKGVELGTKEFEDLKERLIRRERRDEETLLSTIITRDERVLVQPHYIRPGFTNDCPHQLMAEAESVPWSGETQFNFRTNELEIMKPKSGHFRTIIDDNPEITSNFAKSVFNEKGYGNSNVSVERIEVDEFP